MSDIIIATGGRKRTKKEIKHDTILGIIIFGVGLTAFFTLWFWVIIFWYFP